MMIKKAIFLAFFGIGVISFDTLFAMKRQLDIEVNESELNTKKRKLDHSTTFTVTDNEIKNLVIPQPRYISVRSNKEIKSLSKRKPARDGMLYSYPAIVPGCIIDENYFAMVCENNYNHNNDIARGLHNVNMTDEERRRRISEFKKYHPVPFPSNGTGKSTTCSRTI